MPDEWRHDLWTLIERCWDLDWLLLTKRPQNIEKMLPDEPTWENIRGHVWLGTTVEDQEHADQNIPHLLKHDSAVRFISAEPLLGPIDLGNIAPRNGYAVNALEGYIHDFGVPDRDTTHKLDWVITGGESGPHARHSHPEWFVSLHDQCKAAGTPFLFKQWGEWSADQIGPEDARSLGHPPGHVIYERVGKKVAGRKLFGIEHNGFPG